MSQATKSHVAFVSCFRFGRFNSNQIVSPTFGKTSLCLCFITTNNHNLFEPLILKSDWRLTSPYIITAESRIKVTRMKGMITNHRSSWFLNKFSLLALKEINRAQYGEYAFYNFKFLPKLSVVESSTTSKPRWREICTAPSLLLYPQNVQSSPVLKL